MHVFFSGIGGTAIGPLALIAKQAGYRVSGSDKQSSEYTEYLKKQGVDGFHIGQTAAQISAIHDKHPIDWLVYSSAVAMEQEQPAELAFCEQNNIKISKRDEFIAHFIEANQLNMIAIAGTHGKTTTTAMTIWLLQQLDVPVSFSVGAKISFGAMGNYDPSSKYFVYEADEYDHNFLTFHPHTSIITGIDWDHPDIYPTRASYYNAFIQFIEKSQRSFLWQDDAKKLSVNNNDTVTIMNKADFTNTSQLIGRVNRENATIVGGAIESIVDNTTANELIALLDNFPGVSRRFEKIATNIYSDYAHTPEKIRGALQIAEETTQGKKVVVVYEGLHNTRQHFIKNELFGLFQGASKVYVVPSYRAREDESLEDLTPDKLAAIIDKSVDPEPATLNDQLQQAISHHAEAGDLVLCLSAGGGGSLDEWLRQQFDTN